MGEIERQRGETQRQGGETQRQRDIETEKQRDIANNKNPKQSWVAQLVTNIKRSEL